MEMVMERLGKRLMTERDLGRPRLERILQGIGLFVFLLVVCYGATDQAVSLAEKNKGEVKASVPQTDSVSGRDLADFVPMRRDWANPMDHSVLGSLEKKGLILETDSPTAVLPTEGTLEGADQEAVSEEKESVSVPVSVPVMVPVSESPEESAALPTGVELVLHGNGGIPERTEYTYGSGIFSMEELEALEEPKRLGKLFDGWYLDAASENPFTGEATEGTTLELYAGWKEFPGYLCDDAGYVIGYSDAGLIVTDGLVALPTHESCVGIRSGAFAGVEEGIFEVYIPANITKIEEGAFSSMDNLFFIQVASGNPKFYSESGILYHKDGSQAVMPPGR